MTSQSNRSNRIGFISVSKPGQNRFTRLGQVSNDDAVEKPSGLPPRKRTRTDFYQPETSSTQPLLAKLESTIGAKASRKSDGSQEDLEVLRLAFSALSVQEMRGQKRKRSLLEGTEWLSPPVETEIITPITAISLPERPIVNLTTILVPWPGKWRKKGDGFVPEDYENFLLRAPWKDCSSFPSQGLRGKVQGWIQQISPPPSGGFQSTETTYQIGISARSAGLSVSGLSSTLDWFVMGQHIVYKQITNS